MIRLDCADLSGFLSSIRGLESIDKDDPVRLKSGDNVVECMATDLAHTVVARLRSPNPDGEMFLSRKHLAAALSGARGGSSIDLTPIPGNRVRATVHTSVGPKRSTLSLLPENSFSASPTDTVETIPVRMSALRRMLGAVKVVDRGDTRPYFTGACVESRDGFLTATGCNGKQAVRITSDVAAPDGFGGSIVHWASAALIQSLPVDDGDVVGLSIGERQWCLEHEKGRAFGPLVDAKPVDVDAFCPDRFGTEIVFDTPQIKAVMDSIDGVLSMGGKNPALFVSTSSGRVTFAARDGTGETCTATVEVEAAQTGEDAWTWLGGADIARLLSIYRAPSLRLSMTQDGPAVRFDAPEGEQSDAWCVAGTHRYPAWTGAATAEAAE